MNCITNMKEKKMRNLSEEIINKYRGIEIQYFQKSDDELVDFQIEEPIKRILKKFPNIEEITIHPPLYDYEFEVVLLKSKNIFLNQIIPV